MGKLAAERALMLLRFVSSVMTALLPTFQRLCWRSEFDGFQCQISPPTFPCGSFKVEVRPNQEWYNCGFLTWFGARSLCLCCVNTS